MPIPLLPRLNEENKITLTKRGTWRNDSQTTLGNLVTDLNVTTNESSNITSIPDLWARPMMYEMVLFNENHHLHKKYVAEWRGIMAMLAFREMRNLKNIDKEEIVFPDVNKISNNAPSFLKVVSALLSEEYKSYKDETSSEDYKIQLLTFDEQPLALIWPTILICPSVGLERYYTSNISWWNENGITDPISCLNEQEKALLKQWLEGIKENIPDDKDKQYKLNKLIGLIQAYQDDLDVEVKPDNYGLGIGLNITGFCQLVDKPIRCSIDNNSFLAASNVLLINKRQTKNVKNLLVLTDDMYKQWNKSASDIIIAGNINLDAAFPYGNKIFNKTCLNDVDLQQFNTELRSGEDFFTDKICLIEGKNNIFPNALYKEILMYKRAQNIILPIKKELLDYLPPEYIVNNFRVSVVNDLDIKVELDLPLTGMVEEGQILTVQKIYKGKTDVANDKREIVENLALPLIQLWPNFIPHNEQDWQVYYSYYDNLGFDTFTAQPLWDAENCETRNLNYQDDFYAEIVKGNKFPEGYSCNLKVEVTSGVQNVEVGLILIEKPKKLPLDTDNVFKIGIDFGTTNTVAYIKMGNEDPKLLYLEKRLYPVTDYADFSSKAELRRHFFTVTKQPNGDAISIRTLFNSNIGEFKGDLEQPVFPGVAYYLDNFNSIDDDRQVTNLHQGSEMKWAEGNGNGINLITYFLFHIGIQCLAEAVANGATKVEWSYSYPKAFSEEKIAGFKKIWNTRLIKFFKTVAPNSIYDGEENAVIAKTESTAMAEFFKNYMSATMSRGLACFDIGGGSTDIAIWQGYGSNSAKGRCSLKFAGNDILNSHLFKNKNILQNFKNNDQSFNDSIDALCKEKSADEFNLKLEALLKYYEKTLFKALLSKSMNKEVRLFARNIAFALAGEFFYAGMIIGDLKRKGKLGQSLPHCYVGGNGSKLLDWVDGGNFTPDALFSSVYTTCLAYGAVAIKDVQLTKKDLSLLSVNKSDKPKEEVAYGLVCDDSISSTAEDNSSDDDTLSLDEVDIGEDIIIEDEGNKVLAGEIFYLNNEQKDNGSFISVKDVKAGIIVDEELKMFTTFVKIFNTLICKKGYDIEDRIQFTERELAEICDQVNEEFAKQQQYSPERINLEPPFIVVLRQALKCLYKG